MMRYFVLAAVVTAFAAAELTAQIDARAIAFQPWERSSAAEWGKVSRDELAMTVPPIDSGASALILSELCTVRYSRGLDVVTQITSRVKLFSHDGYDAATVTRIYNTFRDAQKIDGIEGATYLLAPDGSVERHELQKKDILTEEAGFFRRVKFTLPALAPGCVIEYRYTFTSSDPRDVPGWRFQHNIPALWSEYDRRAPDAYTFLMVRRGYDSFCIDSVERTGEEIDYADADRPLPVVRNRWAMRNIPAFKMEIDMTTPSDYADAIDFALESSAFPRKPRHDYMETWEKVAKQLAGHPRLGGRLESNDDVANAARRIAGLYHTPAERMRGIYDFIRTTIAFDNYASILTTDGPGTILEKKKGNCADINVLLILMLRGAGMEADPVLLSSRENGEVEERIPSARQFDYLICRAVGGGDTLLLDATDRLRPWHLPSFATLNRRGFLLQGEKFSWIPVTTTAPDSTAVVVQAALDSSGGLRGTVTVTGSDYRALSFREELKGRKPEDLARSFVESELGTLDSFSVVGRDSIHAPLIFRFSFDAPHFASPAGGLVAFNPLTVASIYANPYSNAGRRFPIDLGCRRIKTYRLSLTLPRGYVPQELPRDTVFTVAGGIAHYLSTFHASDTLLEVTRVSALDVPAIGVDRYAEVRAFYDAIVARDGEQVIVGRKAPPPAAVAAPAGTAAKPKATRRGKGK